VSDEHGLLYTRTSMNEQRAAVIEFRDTSSTETTLLRGLIYGAGVFGIATFAMAWKKTRSYGEPQEGWKDS